MADGLGSAEFTGHIDTGCLALNAIVSGKPDGGIPNNSGTAIAGDPATGKTFFVLGILRNFLDADPSSGAFFAETESAVRNAMAEARGIDTKRVIRSEPDTLQKFRTLAVQFLEKYGAKEERPKALMILDSLGMLSSEKEMADALAGEDKRDMTKAQLVKGIFRVIRLKLAKLQVPMLITNHVYAGTGPYAPPKIISGGSGLIYAADTILMLSKKKLKEGDEVVGNIITVKTYKSRLSRENQEVELKLSYDSGLDKWYGMREIAERGGLLKKVSTKVELPDGRKVYGKEIDENPEEVLGPLMPQLSEVCKKLFMYGSDA